MAIVDYSSRTTSVIRIGEDDREVYSIKGGSGNDTLGGNVGNDTLIGGLGNDSLKGNAGDDVFVFTANEGSDIIADYENNDKVSIESAKVTDISTPLDTNDVVFTIGTGNKKGTITFQNAKNKTIHYFDEDGEHFYPDKDLELNSKGTSVTLLANYADDTFNVARNEKVATYANSLVTIDASAVDHDLNITANKKNNKIYGGEGNDEIDGGKGNDTIDGGAGNDTLTGGAGSDVFLYNRGDGKDVIADYAEADSVSIVGNTVTTITKKSGNIIFTLDNKEKITITDGDGKIIHYFDENGEHFYGAVDPIEYNTKGTAATLTADYTKNEYNVNEDESYPKTLVTIDASAVDQDINIVGNAKNNVIIGGLGNDEINGGNGNDSILGGKGADLLLGGKGADTLEGGEGNDTLTGGAGADVFVYSKGGGNDVITDYAEEDTIKIVGDKIATFTKKNNNVIFKLESGKKITVTGGADKVISYTDADGPGTYPEVDLVIYNAKGTGATITANYTDDEFDVADTDYASTLVTIDASAVDQDIEIIANKKNNNILGGLGNDEINGGNGNDSILGGKGADLLLGGKGADTLEGGEGNDTLTGGAGADTFVYNKGDGNDVITDYEEEDIIKIVGDSVSATGKKNENIILKLASGKKITITGGADKVISYIDDSGEHNYPEIVKFNTKGTAATLTADYNKDEFNIADYPDYASSVVTIDALAVDQAVSIIANKKNNYIVGGLSNDEINGGKGNDSIAGGAGDDTLYGGAGADTFIYNKGDGKDVIADYTEDDFIAINGDAVAKVTKKNGNAILTLDSKKTITILDAADKKLNYTGAVESVEFNAKGTGATLTADYTDDKFDIADYEDYASSVVTIDASAVDQDIEIIANKKNNKIIGGLGNDEIDGGNGNDSIAGGAGDDTLYGGAGADTFIYNKGDGKDVIADYTEDDFIAINGDAVAKVTKKNGNAILTLDSKKTITILDAADKKLNYTGAVESVEFNAKGTGATLTADYTDDKFDIADYEDYASTLVTIDASAVDQDIEIIANKKNNKIIGGLGNDEIDGGNGNDSILGGKGADLLLGGKGADTLEGGEGNDTLTGGAGADTFVYNYGDGNDVISDYEEEDTVNIVGDKIAKFSKKNDNVIFKLESGKTITFTGGADKVINYTDDKGSGTYPATVKFNAKGTEATLTADYNKDEFNIADYDEYKDSVVTINASKVQHDISIIGNKNANQIIGSANNDSLWGGKGNDTLYGGDGADTFVYNDGDGKDIIADFTSIDQIMIYSGNYGGYSAINSDVTFNIGNGSITVTDGADKYIELVDSSGKHLTHYSPRV